MKRFIEGRDRDQATLFPERLDEAIGPDNPVRVVDAFIDALDLSGLGFDVTPEATGRPGYHPATLLKIYLYGYTVGYNVQSVVDTKNHLIVTHEVTNVGIDRDQLSSMAGLACEALDAETIEVLADKGYFKGEEIAACEEAGIDACVPKAQTSNSRAQGRVDKDDFIYDPENDHYECPAGQLLTRRMTRDEKGRAIHVYWTNVCGECPLKSDCTTGKERRVRRWEHEDVVDRTQVKLDSFPGAMQQRRETVEHPFGTIKAWMGATHFKMKTLAHVATEMALHVLAYNIKRVIAILGVPELIEAIVAFLMRLVAEFGPRGTLQGPKRPIGAICA